MPKYGHIKQAWDRYDDWLRSLIRSRNPKKILEVGGGASPALETRDLADLGVREYTVLDISQRELAKAPAAYKKICADICSSNLSVSPDYDLVISRMVAEHVRHPRRFHRNIYNLLAPDGRAFHFFPTLFCPVSLVNIFIPERIGYRLLRLFRPQVVTNSEQKFPAYYRWTYGPVPFQIRRFERLGYEVEMYDGFFGHGYYNRIPVLRNVHWRLTEVLVKHPSPYLTSCAYLVLRKPVAFTGTCELRAYEGRPVSYETLAS